LSSASYPLRVREADGSRQLLAPSVGIFTPSVREGQLVSGGQKIGTLELLSVSHVLVVPDGVAGRVIARIGGRLSRVPVQYGDVLLGLSSAELADPSSSEAGAELHSGALSFPAPMSGRFYGRPSPSEPPFVSPGDTVNQGQTIGLLEVMKTFNRLVYQGEGLPEQAVVEKVVVNDGDDVVRGEPILRLAPNDAG
jgi:acetyl-CoA carboxylase biotin carboxyl carrier protein